VVICITVALCGSSLLCNFLSFRNHSNSVHAILPFVLSSIVKCDHTIWSGTVPQSIMSCIADTNTRSCMCDSNCHTYMTAC